MPQIDSLNDYPLFAHVEAVIVSLHYLKLKLRKEIKACDTIDENMPRILRLLLREMETSKTKLSDDVARLETRYDDLRRNKVQ